MKIKELQDRPVIDENAKLNSCFQNFSQLLAILRKRELPDTIVAEINERIDWVNQEVAGPKTLRKTIQKQRYDTLKLLEKELKIVPRNYYRNRWIALGMTVFGIPLGVALGTALDNMAFMGIGLPIGMVFGIAVGTEKDKKAQAEGRQLDIEYEL